MKDKEMIEEVLMDLARKIMQKEYCSEAKARLLMLALDVFDRLLETVENESLH